ncbi:hypothetical protein BB560_001780 [Smittium megazygosporum]|uniref:Uncharacterized protein n=1 Tax=Smittium megazygosporum TaxID=133381 RepID=A0A2T9ZGJ8_9FUNG|nr:hypothetical protein BB560_001783 [Smittium megazygosporum]PVV03714.1 hypothetical protein BB560_001780 [Smittium megazygosporum]
MFSRTLVRSRALFALSKNTSVAMRAFSVSAASKSHDNNEIYQGPGATPGKIPTDIEQATGLDRLERLAALENESLYNLDPIDLRVKGTKAAPTIIPSDFSWRIIGCQGPPGEDHELLWLKLERKHGIDRCPECGNVYKLSDLE